MANYNDMYDGQYWETIKPKNTLIQKTLEELYTAETWINTVTSILARDTSTEAVLEKCKVLLQFALDSVEESMELLDDQLDHGMVEIKDEEATPVVSIPTVFAVPNEEALTAREDDAHYENRKKIENWLEESKREVKDLEDKLAKIKQIRMEQERDPKIKKYNKSSSLAFLDPDTGDIGIDND
jgi:hypothetical protein